MKRVIETSHAIALAVKLARVKVIPMYPITPQTHIVERLAEFINNGTLDAKMIHVESEHSAISALQGALLSNVRAFTATSSQGLALMFEILQIISGMRLPAVMVIANRALSAPINIWNDHSDAFAVRDQGWMQIFAETAEEALDSVLMAYKLAESKEVQIPIMVNIDGYSLSHVYEPVDIPSQTLVDSFLPKFKLEDYLDINNPKTFGPIGFPDSYMYFKEAQHKAMKNAEKRIKEINREFKKKFKRSYGNGLVEEYKIEDAETVFVCLGSICGTAREAVDQLRVKGKKAGLLKLRYIRPWPSKSIRKALNKAEKIAVFDRAFSFGSEAPLYTELKATLQDKQINSYVVGLGGRDVTIEHFKKAYRMCSKNKNGWLY
ncbi:MAG: pyruvate ferredoxin oxidoreductase [Candidatus Diapherotrites archaeon]|nr:pyruvate ferredoxin oxidoreductase [Candidatus Diapherotrites archaeon]